MTERYSRQIALFGAEGQAKIAACRVAIAGLGGLGSHIAQQLAYLGVQQFVLVDHDTVSDSNLNRLIGATPEDLAASKVNVAKAMILRIQPDAEVKPTAEEFDPARAQEQLAGIDFVFGCFDEDVPRLQLTEYSARHRIPYLDIASDVSADGTEYGGRLILAADGQGCCSCFGEIDQHELTRAQMTDEQRAADDAIYGVDRAALDATGPSVVSLNGTIASLAVTEFMACATGLREPVRHLTYYGHSANVRPSRDKPATGCYYCTVLWPESSDEAD